MNRARILIPPVSALAIVVIWKAAAAAVDAPLILPSPEQTLSAFCRLAVGSSFWRHVGTSALRAVEAFGISALLGLVLGVCAGLSDVFRRLLLLPLALIRAAPLVSFILIAVFWFGSAFVPVFSAALMCLPVMTQAVISGIQHTDHRLLEMARVYRFSRCESLVRIRFPQALPFFVSGLMSSFGLSWKVVAAGEVLSLPRFGAGSLLYTAKVHLNTDEVFALTLTLVLCSFTAERFLALILKPALKNRGSV